jgi:hypothetical protein
VDGEGVTPNIEGPPGKGDLLKREPGVGVVPKPDAIEAAPAFGAAKAKGAAEEGCDCVKSEVCPSEPKPFV